MNILLLGNIYNNKDINGRAILGANEYWGQVGTNLNDVTSAINILLSYTVLYLVLQTSIFLTAIGFHKIAYDYSKMKHAKTYI